MRCRLMILLIVASSVTTVHAMSNCDKMPDHAEQRVCLKQEAARTTTAVIKAQEKLRKRIGVWN
ncbi:MAG: hypothetical protein ACRETO_06035, partial [Gammaproteobacteria bacterium]